MAQTHSAVTLSTSRLQFGFGLLEAIVALAILTSSGLALFSWINQNIETAARLKRLEQQAQLQLSALAFTETINPSLTTRGQVVRGSMELEWFAQLIEPARQNTTFYAQLRGPWSVGLYRLRVKARDSKQGQEVEFTQFKVGTQRTVAKEGAP